MNTTNKLDYGVHQSDFKALLLRNPFTKERKDG